MNLQLQTEQRGRRGADLERDNGKIVAIGRIDESVVKDAYRRWAPVYDHTMGKVTTDGRRHAVRLINEGRGRVLEVGVGTGLSLPDYGDHLEIIGIDLSPDMLDRARDRVREDQLSNVIGIHEMDAGDLDFPNNHFDTVVAMFVMTVVPDPERVMRELARVTKPGGSVILVNHFSQEEGVRGWLERRMAPFAEIIGWRPVFDVSRVMVCEDLDLVGQNQLRPMGIFTMMRFQKQIDARAVAAE